MSQADLLVVGGGPAGASLAALAAAAGARVVVVERARFPRDKVCGEFVSAEGRAVLARLGLLGELESAGAQWMAACRLTDTRGRELVVGLPDLPRTGPLALGVTRALLDSTLLALALRKGAELRQPQEATAPLFTGGRVAGMRVRAVGSRGDGEEIRAGIVVAADGRRSVLGRALHPRLGDPRRSDPGSWFGLKVHLDADPARLARRIELHLFDGGYAGLAPVEGRRVNLCLMTRVRALRACGGSPARVLTERVLSNPAARERIDGSRPVGRWHSVGPLRFGVRRPSASGALFVGDAAGTTDPFCGEGISNALVAAELALPFALEAASSGGLDPDLALGYERAWLRAFAPVTARARRLGLMLGDPGLAGPILALLAGPARWLAPRLAAATRTGTG